jgi:hypothetical protein
MLNPPAGAPATNPDGRGAPEVSLDAQTWRGRAITTGNRGRFRRQTSLLVLFGGGGRSYSTHERTRMSRLSGECRVKRLKQGVAEWNAWREQFPDVVEVYLRRCLVALAARD